MRAAPSVPILRGSVVELVPLELTMVGELAAAAGSDRATYGFTEVPAGIDAMAGYLSKLINQRGEGTAVPFAQRLIATGELVGCTRFMELRSWRGRGVPDEVEIGGTWLRADVQRSAVNTDAKLLLLTQAFDVWGVVRVALCTDERNERSRRAIERIGGQLDGILRRHRPSTVTGESGQARNSALYSILADEWPPVRAQLESRLEESA